MKTTGNKLRLGVAINSVIFILEFSYCIGEESYILNSVQKRFSIILLGLSMAEGRTHVNACLITTPHMKITLKSGLIAVGTCPQHSRKCFDTYIRANFPDRS